MGKTIRLNQQTARSDSELVKALHLSALKYSRYAGKKLLYIFRSSGKISPYEDYEVYFGRENFMHLAGFKKGVISASEFFDKCFEGKIELGEVLFKENRKAASAKLDVLPTLLDYRHVKIYKMGKTDLITEKNKFEVGLGNCTGIIGFDRRSDAPALPVPTTVMKRSILDYVSKPKNVVAILMKNNSENYYNFVIGSVAAGIKREELPTDIAKKISAELETILLKK